MSSEIFSTEHGTGGFRRYDPGQVLVSLHIPKTAGTSFAEVLKAWFGDGYVDHLPPDVPERPVTGAGLCVHGHFPAHRGYSAAGRYPGAQMITVLRDPFERMMSYWRYASENLARGGAPHPDMTDHPSFDLWFDRYLASTGAPNAPNFVALMPSPTPGASAEAVVRGFLAVGISERLDETVALFAQVLGKPPVAVPRLNETRKTDADLSAYRKRYETVRGAEYEMYEAAKRIFAARIDGLPGETR